MTMSKTVTPAKEIASGEDETRVKAFGEEHRQTQQPQTGALRRRQWQEAGSLSSRWDCRPGQGPGLSDVTSLLGPFPQRPPTSLQELLLFTAHAWAFLHAIPLLDSTANLCVPLPPTTNKCFKEARHRYRFFPL